MPASSSAIQRDPIRAPRAHLFGVSVAMVTPFRADGSVDLARKTRHAAAVLASGAEGITLFGTTGEGASIGLGERGAMLAAMIEAGIDAKAITVGIAASSIETAESQIRLAYKHGVHRLLLAPPFYFKDIADEGLFLWVSALAERIADCRPEIILYHIPQVTGVRFEPALVRRLKDALGEAIFGVKDSAGDWAHTEALLPMDDLAILVGDERLLARAAPLGGAGAISGMANLVPELIGRMIHEGEASADLDALVDDLVKAPVTPLVKALVGAAYGDDAWYVTRPPLLPADREMVADLARRMETLRSLLDI